MPEEQEEMTVISSPDLYTKSLVRIFPFPLTRDGGGNVRNILVSFGLVLLVTARARERREKKSSVIHTAPNSQHKQIKLGEF